MPTPLYECVHVPMKTAFWAIKNPIPAGVGAFFSLVIFAFYGIWPFIAIGGTLTAGMITFMVLVSRKAAAEARIEVQARASDIPRKQNFLMDARCIRHEDRVAASIYRIPLPSGGIKIIPVCRACIPDFEVWLDSKQLTRG